VVVEHGGVVGQDGSAGEAHQPAHVLPRAVAVHRGQVGELGCGREDPAEQVVDQGVRSSVEPEGLLGDHDVGAGRRRRLGQLLRGVGEQVGADRGSPLWPAGEGRAADDHRKAGSVRGRDAPRGPDEVGGHRARQREHVDVTHLQPPLEVVRRHRRTQHGDVRARLGSERRGHPRRQGVPLTLGAGDGDARTAAELPAGGHHPQRRHGGLGDGGGRVLLGDRPLAPLPQLPDARLSRTQDVLHDLAQRRSGLQQVHDQVRRGDRVAAHERVEVAVQQRRRSSGHARPCSRRRPCGTGQGRTCCA
jgi:hypothetical protein